MDKSLIATDSFALSRDGTPQSVQRLAAGWKVRGSGGQNILTDPDPASCAMGTGSLSGRK
jgi:hypothetical protein